MMSFISEHSFDEQSFFFFFLRKGKKFHFGNPSLIHFCTFKCVSIRQCESSETNPTQYSEERGRTKSSFVSLHCFSDFGIYLGKGGEGQGQYSFKHERYDVAKSVCTNPRRNTL